MKRLSRMVVVATLLLLAFLVVWVGLLSTGSRPDAPVVQVLLLGFTNDAAMGRCARFMITNGLGNDVLYAQTVETRGQTGWPTYTNGSRLPHSAFTPLEMQDSVTLTAAVPTNGAWRVSVVYQELQTRRGEDPIGIRTAISDALHPKQKQQGRWIWSSEVGK